MTVVPTKSGVSIRSKLLVVTDLDGTLLDDAYRWDAASTALAALRSQGFPLILSSSKTLDEMMALAAELNTGAPLIAENGGLVAVPMGGHTKFPPFGDEVVGPYGIACSGLARTDILETAHRLRTEASYHFEGFSDWGVEEVCTATGLSATQASLALKRRATEPILWQDSATRWNAFAAALHAAGIGTVKGGRFIHLSGNINKAAGLERVLRLYQQIEPDTHWHVVALGDSPNDLEMLSAADTAVVIPNPRHPSGLAPAAPRVLHAPDPGPTGWNAAMLALLGEYKNDS
jgi:mannosyl-3-phosphoglycerate phosphatase